MKVKIFLDIETQELKGWKKEEQQSYFRGWETGKSVHELGMLEKLNKNALGKMEKNGIYTQNAHVARK